MFHPCSQNIYKSNSSCTKISAVGCSGDTLLAELSCVSAFLVVGCMPLGARMKFFLVGQGFACREDRDLHIELS